MDMANYALGVSAVGTMLLDVIRSILVLFTTYETTFAFFAIALLGIAITVGSDFLATVAHDMLSVGSQANLNDLKFHNDIKALSEETRVQWYNELQLQEEWKRNLPYQEYTDGTEDMPK